MGCGRISRRLRFLLRSDSSSKALMFTVGTICEPCVRPDVPYLRYRRVHFYVDKNMSTMAPSPKAWTLKHRKMQMPRFEPRPFAHARLSHLGRDSISHASEDLVCSF
ncbi:hypothetical protein ES702_07817 [subsurface metagenome]